MRLSFRSGGREKVRFVESGGREEDQAEVLLSAMAVEDDSVGRREGGTAREAMYQW